MQKAAEKLDVGTIPEAFVTRARLQPGRKPRAKIKLVPFSAACATTKL
jgi:hypothetical protein